MQFHDHMQPVLFVWDCGCMKTIKESLLHITPTCAGTEEGSDHFGCMKTIKKGSPVHVAPTCARSEEGYDHFGSYVRSLSLHFCKRLFPGLEPMTSSRGA
jgi:hypothetical protein